MTSPCLYLARVMHLRVLPDRARQHRFHYTLFRLWLDIDRLAETAKGLRLLGHNRFNLYSIHERDHGPRDGSPLRPWVEEHLAAEGVARPARIMLYCFPRVFGYEFNPLAMYCAYDAGDALSGVVYQVRNTDGDLKPYAVNIEAEGLRHGAAKDFYVSPFIDGDQSYAFTLSEPQETLALRIRVDGQHGLTLIATENADARPLTDAALLRLLFLRPLMTVKITAGIYFEALRLRLKGASFYKHPGNNGIYPRGPARKTTPTLGPAPDSTGKVQETL